MSIIKTATNGEHFSTPLCRYVTFRRFCEMLFTQQLTLVSPKLWNDKYENYILNIINSSNGAEEIRNQLQSIKGLSEKHANKVISFAKVYFPYARCLCFSKSIDAEVMWNAYGDRKETIMWVTTREKLECIDRHFYVIDVSYDLESIGVKGFVELFDANDDRATIYDSQLFLSHKRSFFSYENEVRVISLELTKEKSEIYSYKIDLLSGFIDGVMVHPLASDDYVKLIGKMCEHFNIEFLGKSHIYEMNKIY